MHNFTVSAQDIFYLASTFSIYRKFYRKLASTNADNETVCIVLLNSQVVMVQSSSQRMFLFFVLFCIFTFIRFV